jgi:GTP-binding protein HflX
LPNGSGGVSKREKVIAVGMVLRDRSHEMVREHLEELAQLIETAGGEVVGTVVANRPSPDPATWIGKGKVEEIAALAGSLKADLIIFDDDLSGSQARNVGKATDRMVLDRSGLILDIFAKGARSRESKTQVELAQLQYLLPRLTRQWTHLSRQAGGIGTRGVGETQLEIDRRIVRTRIARLREELSKIEQNRATQRKSRSEAFTVALVGYTNAGKSTLFNSLTSGGAEAANKLFATLDSRAHKIEAPMPRETIVVDTVGFIRKLPHHLVASFRSTMEEAVSADLVLHVIDASHGNVEEQREVGNAVLEDLGIDRSHVLEVYNKLDRIQGAVGFDRGENESVLVSALTGAGIDLLIEATRQRELKSGEIMNLIIPYQESRVVAQLHELADIHHRREGDGAYHFVAWVPRSAIHLFDNFASQEDQAVEQAG